MYGRNELSDPTKARMIWTLSKKKDYSMNGFKGYKTELLMQILSP